MKQGEDQNVLRAEIRVFLSYPREEQQIATDIRDRLEDEGFTVWMDRSGLDPGVKWKRAIESEIKRSQVVIVCYNSRWSEARYQRIEFDLAVRNAGNKIIPVRVERCSKIDELEEYNRVDVTDLLAASSWSRFIAAIDKMLPSEETAPDAAEPATVKTKSLAKGESSRPAELLPLELSELALPVPADLELQQKLIRTGAQPFLQAGDFEALKDVLPLVTGDARQYLDWVCWYDLARQARDPWIKLGRSIHPELLSNIKEPADLMSACPPVFTRLNESWYVACERYLADFLRALTNGTGPVEPDLECLFSLPWITLVSQAKALANVALPSQLDRFRTSLADLTPSDTASFGLEKIKKATFPPTDDEICRLFAMAQLNDSCHELANNLETLSAQNPAGPISAVQTTILDWAHSSVSVDQVKRANMHRSKWTSALPALLERRDEVQQSLLALAESGQTFEGAARHHSLLERLHKAKLQFEQLKASSLNLWPESLSPVEEFRDSLSDVLAIIVTPLIDLKPNWIDSSELLRLQQDLQREYKALNEEHAQWSWLNELRSLDRVSTSALAGAPTSLFGVTQKLEALVEAVGDRDYLWLLGPPEWHPSVFDTRPDDIEELMSSSSAAKTALGTLGSSRLFNSFALTCLEGLDTHVKDLEGVSASWSSYCAAITRKQWSKAFDSLTKLEHTTKPIPWLRKTTELLAESDEVLP